MHKHVVIAGAGPAGLAAAHTIVSRRPDFEVLLLEAGRPYRRRPCPVDKGFACTGCGGVCNVISGFGGSMHYGDGAKLSKLPSGRRLIDHIGGDRAEDLCTTAFDWLTAPLDTPPPLLGRDLSLQARSAFAAHDLSIREYPVAVLGESDLGKIIEGLHDQLAPRLDLWHSSELVGAQYLGTALRLTVRAHHTVQHIDADHLVLATGRRGVTAAPALLRDLGIESRQPDISIGVRLEMPVHLLTAIGNEHPDLKITQLDHAEKIKTFCFCGGVNGGRIKFTHYHHAFGANEPIITLDGHETTERPSGDRPLASNFGLLCQPSGRGGAVEARDSFLTAYRNLSGGRPFAQPLRDFLARTDTPDTWASLQARLPFQPSIQDLTCGRVDQLFTNAEHASLTAGFRRLMESILRHGEATTGTDGILDDVLVVGPELEFLWELPPVDEDFRVPGLPVHVIGDAAGIAQGIVQAAMTGIAAGDAISRPCITSVQGTGAERSRR